MSNPFSAETFTDHDIGYEHFHCMQPGCRAFFATKIELDRHVQDGLHGGDEESATESEGGHKCWVVTCQREFDTESQLYLHMGLSHPDIQT